MVERTAFRVSAITAVAMPFVMLAVILGLGVNMPYWDEWGTAELLYRAHRGTLTFADVWHDHGGHRVFLSTVVQLALAKFGGWDVVREQCFSLAVMVATQIALWGLVRRTVAARYAAPTLLLMTIALYNVAQVENLSWGIEILFFIPNLCLVAVVLLLTGADIRAGRYVAAIAFATIGSLSMSQGLIIWIVGVACMIARRDPVKWTAAWAISAAIVAWIVRAGIAPNTKIPYVPLAAHVWDFAAYLFAYLGSPLARSLGVAWAVFAGSLSLAVVAWSIAGDARSSDPARAFARRLPWYAIAGYVVSVAVLTTSQRLGFGVAQALDSRYTTIPVLLDVAIAGVLGTHLPFVATRTRAVVIAISAVMVLAVAQQSFAGLRTWQTISALRHGDVEALARGDLVGSDIHWDPQRLPALLEELRAARTGIFSP